MATKVIGQGTDGSYTSMAIADAGAVAAAASGGLSLAAGEMSLATAVAGKGLSLTSGVLDVVLPGRGAKTAISTAGAGTLTAAAIVGGLIMRTGPIGSYTDTTDTATAILALLDTPYAGQSWEFTVVNGVAQTCTFAAGSGITLAGVVDNAASKVRRYHAQVTNVGTPAITITGIGEMVA